MNTHDRNDETKNEVCACETFIGADGDACTRFQDYLTKEEEEVLRMMRDLRGQAVRLKGKIKDIEKSVRTDNADRPAHVLSEEEKERLLAEKGLFDEWRDCTDRLEELRSAWKEWQVKKEEAHHRKMVMLGHRPPDAAFEIV